MVLPEPVLETLLVPLPLEVPLPDALELLPPEPLLPSMMAVPPQADAVAMVTTKGRRRRFELTWLDNYKRPRSRKSSRSRGAS